MLVFFNNSQESTHRRESSASSIYQSYKLQNEATHVLTIVTHTFRMRDDPRLFSWL